MNLFTSRLEQARSKIAFSSFLLGGTDRTVGGRYNLLFPLKSFTCGRIDLVLGVSMVTLET